MSGARRDRPELERLLDQVREENVVVVTRLDRLARSTRDLLDIAERLRDLDAGLRSLAEPWADTTSPAGGEAARRALRAATLPYPGPSRPLAAGWWTRAPRCAQPPACCAATTPRSTARWAPRQPCLNQADPFACGRLTQSVTRLPSH